MLTIALTIAVFVCDSRRWMRFVVIAALCLIVVQGVIGGLRVIQDERQLAKLHGCLGPLFFALATALAAFTSRLWKNAPAWTSLSETRSDASLGETRPRGGHSAQLHRVALLTAALAYVQLVLGANLRHIPVTAGIDQFRMALFFHLIGAAAVAAHVLLLAAHIVRRYRTEAALRRAALLLVVLIVFQLLLGAGSWVVKYSLPTGSEGAALVGGLTLENEGMLQAVTVTAHTAGGSLILALSVLVALRALRLAPRGRDSALPVSPSPNKAVKTTA
jgi:cytochrome c oxidase assembly protein subunit 15